MHHPVMGFEHLHRHSDSSLLDGMALVKEYAERSKQVNQDFLCISDHGVMGAVPEQISESEKHGLFPIFACELYVNPMQIKADCRDESAEFRRNLPEDQQKRFDKSSHLLAIAYNNEGYKNLVRLTSWAWKHGFYKKPRVNHEVLMQYKEGLIFTSTCANSEIANAFLKNQDDQEGFDMLEKYMSMFDKFYLELMMLDFKLQKPYDAFLIRAHQKYGLPLILSQDCFVAGTLVLTDQGYKSIEDIQVDDFVLTHENRFRRVEVVAKRPLKERESIYQIKATVGSYAFGSTGDHKIYVGSKEEKVWSVNWKKVKDLIPKKDFLLVPKILASHIFSPQGPNHIDLINFIDASEYQLGDDYQSSTNGNMGCRLQYDPKEQEFVSYRGFDRKCKTTIPRHLPVDDDFLKMVGWYIAEGWSEKESNQVGFALHSNEQEVADWIIRYFSRFGIIAKTYKVSDNGIAVRFSSVVFNRFLGQLCGCGANNKHLPRLYGHWMGVWDKRQIAKMLSCFWQGDGSGDREGVSAFRSTSKGCIYEIAAVFNALGMPSLPSVDRPSKRGKDWSDCWSLHFTGVRSHLLHDFFEGKEVELQPSSFWTDLGQSWAIAITGIDSVEYNGLVYDMQVHEDHSYTANLHKVSNCHYCNQEHSKFQRLMLMMQNGRTIQELEWLVANGEDDIFELQDSNLWMKSEEELNMKWESDYQNIIDYELYKQSKANTVEICRLARGVEIDRSIKLPELPDQDSMLKQAIIKGIQERGIPEKRKKEYLDRIKMEFDLITKKKFSSYFLIEQQMVKEAMRICPELCGFDDISVARGPGRGSQCGSVIGYYLDLHDVDPIEHDLSFSRFLSWARGGKQMRIKFTQKPYSTAKSEFS